MCHGSLTISGGTFTNEDTIDIDSGKSLTISGGGIFIHKSNDFTNNGTITMAGTSTASPSTMKVFAGIEVTNGGILNITGDNNTIDLESTTEGGTGTFTNNDTINIGDVGDVENSASLTISGNGTFTNSGSICNNGSLTISGNGTFTNSSYIANNGSLTISGSGSFVMESESSLWVSSSRTFSVSDSNTHHNVTLNGTIAINSQYASVDVSNMNFFDIDTVSGEVTRKSNGTIDMSPLRQFPEYYEYLLNYLTTTQTLENYNFFTFVADTTNNGQLVKGQALPNIKLPFNCQFNGGLNLRNAASVSYTVLRFVNSAKIDNYIIKVGDIPSQVNQDDIAVSYGDYANDTLELGVTLPNDADKLYPDNQNVATLYLSYLVNKKDENDELKYNKSDYQLDTDDLDDAPDTIEAGEIHTYNFGFIGTKAISIKPEDGAQNTKAVFMGDNSGYAPSTSATISVSEVEFGNKSLFQFTQTSQHGVFKSL